MGINVHSSVGLRQFHIKGRGGNGKRKNVANATKLQGSRRRNGSGETQEKTRLKPLEEDKGGKGGGERIDSEFTIISGALMEFGIRQLGRNTTEHLLTERRREGEMPGPQKNTTERAASK